MSRISTYFKNRICLWLLPLLLTAAVGSVLIDCFATSNIAALKVSYALFALSAFVLFDRLHKLRIIGGLLYTVLFIVIMLLSLRYVYFAEYTGRANISFQQWFYGIGVTNGVTVATPYFYALFIGGGFFINSVLYYFTQVQYRALGTLLIIFIPFVIYAKRDDQISDLSVTIIITLFVAIIVHNRIFLEPDSGKGTVVNTAYVMSIALFVSVTGALAMIFPDLSSPSRLEKDANFLNFAGYNATGSTKLRNSDSSTRMHGVQYTNEPLFYVIPEDQENTEFPLYLRRRSMNAYDADKLDWYVSSDLKKKAGIYTSIDVSFPDLFEAEKSKGAAGRFIADAEPFDKKYDKNYSGYTITFEDTVGNVPYIPAPIYSDVRVQDGFDAFFVCSDYYDVSPAVPPDQLGDVRLNVVNCQSQAEEFAAAAGGAFNDFEHAVVKALRDVSYLDDDESIYNDDGSAKEGYELAAYMIDNDRYSDYYDLVSENYHYDPSYLQENGLKDYDRIKELADEICKDCESDYEKAKAIEQYFTDEGFEYDLDYIPPDESVSYFLFESRRGICIDFASAMGVMLIMEKIPVRYVEGFVAFERDPEDSSRLVVRDSHAHAFIEAFIPYVGWMTFDPTVAGYMRTGENANADNGANTLTIILAYMGRILLVLGVLFVLVFIILFDRIWELFFRLTMRFYQPDKQLTRLYNHIFALLEYEDKTNLKPYTSRLLNDYLRIKTGQSLTQVTDIFEQHRFGGREVTAEQFTAAYEAYKALYPKIRRKNASLAVNG